MWLEQKNVAEISWKILIRRLTWHWACDCSFRCFRHYAFIKKTKLEADPTRDWDEERLSEAANWKKLKKTLLQVLNLHFDSGKNHRISRFAWTSLFGIWSLTF